MTDLPDPTPDTEVVSGEAPDDPNGEWLSIPEAVARTGRTERTIRRGIAANVYETRQVKGRVQLWFPRMSGPPPDTGITSGIAPDMPPDAHSVALAVLEQQQALMSHLAELARQEQAPLLELVERQAQRLEALAAENATLKAELATARQPWYRRLWHALGA